MKPKDASDLAEAKTILDELRTWLKPKVEAHKLATRSKLPYKAISLREPLLYRIVELGDVTCKLYQDNAMASAFTLTRSTLEASAMLYWLHMKIDETIKLGRVDKELDNLLMRALLGRSDRQVSRAPLNVQTCINHADKKFNGIKQMYDNLSEYAHPNWFGVMSLYGKSPWEKYCLNLGWPEKGARAGEGLPLLCGALELFRFYYQAISNDLQKFIEVCDQDITRRESADSS
jgi:hypothetical protein